MKSEKETSELIWLGRRLDKALPYIKKHHHDLTDGFLKLVKQTFERIILEDLTIEKEDYLFETLDEALDYLEESFNTVFENKITDKI
jgi:hypothetical protein